MILATTSAFYLAVSVLFSGVVEHDPFTGAVKVIHYSFENDEDQDFDEQPDDWTRRKGPSFPSYVRTGIDRKRGRQGKQSLEFRVNGGQVITYSPITRIDPLHSYVFQGYIRTQQLNHNAALISVSFLNHKRQRIQRFLSKVVGGTHQDWVRVRIGPVAPRQDVRFVVIGCHLVQGKKMDIRGSIWFDDLWLGKLPQLSLVSNYQTHFKQRFAPIQINSQVSGLDPGRNYQLHLEIIDSSGEVLASTVRKLEPIKQEANAIPNGDVATQRRLVEWLLPPQEYGFYMVHSTLQRDETVVLEERTSFSVMDLIRHRGQGEFGWSIAIVPDRLSLRELADVSTQGGINWLKFPLWNSVYTDNPELPAKITELFELLVHRGITPVGLLNNPPLKLRSQFAHDWSGISEIFTMQPSFWSPSLEPVIARYSSNVRYWQLGNEADRSFAGMKTLSASIANVKAEFDRIGRDTRIGLHWDWNTPLPSRSKLSQSFLSISNDQPLSASQLTEQLKSSNRLGVPRWVLLKPLARSKSTPEERGADLVKRMVAAKIGGAEAIFAYDVFHEEYGLLKPNGSPTLLFLPWRTTALALQGAKYLGSFHLPNGSQNFAFSREDEVVLVVWDEEPKTEEVYLGNNVVVMDVWGRQHRAQVNKATGRQIIQVGPVPQIMRGCSKPVALWRMAVQFEKGRVRSAYGAHEDTIRGVNPFPQGVSGTATLNIPDEWEVDPGEWKVPLAKKERFELPMLLTLPANASLGTWPIFIDFDVVADRPYKFRVYRTYQVGLGDVLVDVIEEELEDGRLKIEQIITNKTSPVEVLNFRCSLFIPGHKRLKQFVTKLGIGQDRKLYFIPNAKEMRGKELWLRAEQVRGRRILNKRWKVGELEETTGEDQNPTSQP